MSTESDAQPERLVTVNQVVAWNIAWYRRAAGLKQDQLAALLGWTRAKVSEAERSWKGDRTRKFDAQELAELSLALGVPLAGLLFPPEDDGTAVRYVFPGPAGKGRLSMGDLLADVIFANPDDFSDQAEAYRQRMVFASTKYLAPDWAAMLARLTKGEADRTLWDDLGERLRTRAQQLMDAAAEFSEVAEVVSPMYGDEEAKEAGQ